MGDLGGSWLELGSPLQAAAAAAANASLTGGAGFELSGQTQLVLEILMVLMCLGAVTGTNLPVNIQFIIINNIN